MASRFDVAIVGGGPAGLALAIGVAAQGLSVAVFERSGSDGDKACGEGIMPAGVRALEALGVRARLPSDTCRPFSGIRYIDMDGTTAEGKLPAEALAVRRVALANAMAERAAEVGADLRFKCGLVAHRRTQSEMILETEGGPERARMLVAADGLASRLRSLEGLDVPWRGARRFGLRRHFTCAPWSSFVEVHLGVDAEAYVTPVSSTCVGIAFLWSEASQEREGDPWSRLERQFPRIRERLAGAAPQSRVRGAGPLARVSSARTRDRFALVGDAAGYLDAITGDGISLSLLSAAALARVIPRALEHGADQASLASYEREYTRLYRRYSLSTKGVLAVARHPRLRRKVLRLLQRFPGLFDRLLSFLA